MYRGEKWPDLEGAYLYGDYSTGRIWAVRGLVDELIVQNYAYSLKGFQNDLSQSAIHRAHEERGKAVVGFWSWLFGSR